MKIRELYEQLNRIIPRSLSCEWDNDGLMCCPDPDREVKKALFCLDVSDGAVELAIKEGFDVIVSHHPMIFRGIKALVDDNGVNGKTIRLIKAGISVMSFHTRFDAVDGGVNDTLAALFGLRNVTKLECEGIELGRVGYLNAETSLEEFASAVKEKLCAPRVSYGKCTDKVHKVAIVGGGGGDFVRAAANAGADTFLSGDIGYHTVSDAHALGINLVEAGHYYTEQPSCASLAEIVLRIDPSIETKVIESNTIFCI